MCFRSLSRCIFLGIVCLVAAAWASPQSSATANEAACTLCFYGPDNIVFDAAGNAYITDNDHTSHFRVLKVSPQGTRIAEWQVFRAVQGRGSGPEGIAIDSDGNIFVTDGGGLRVLKFSPHRQAAHMYREQASMVSRSGACCGRLSRLHLRCGGWSKSNSEIFLRWQAGCRLAAIQGEWIRPMEYARDHCRSFRRQSGS